jgi:hypothetical protein
MAVYYATRQYRILGRCLRAGQVKNWIKGRERASDLPSAASVLTVSAPNMLLSSSLNSFLVGLGVYLGFTWTRSLDEVTGTRGSRAVFIFYVVGLAVCYGVYAASSTVVADQEDWNLWEVFRKMVEDGIGDYGIPMQESANADPERSAALQRLPGSARRQDGPDRQELLQVLREAAKLRKASTELDERLARILERLG